MWQYILTSLSAVLFFGFVIIGVMRFGLLSCYSAYGPKWETEISGHFNLWSFVTIGTALLIISVAIEIGKTSPWQFLGFLAPASLILVGITPDYQTNTFAYVLHQIGALSAVVFIVLYSILIPKLVLVVLGWIGWAVLGSLIYGFKQTWMFWGEMAMYISTYTIMFAAI